MASKQKVPRSKSAPKPRAEKPVTRIEEAAERAGIKPAHGSPEHIAAFTAKRKELADRTLTLTVGEACDLVGRDLEPSEFTEQVFETIARDLDVLSDLAENGNGFDGWCAFQNLCERIKLAGKIAAVIGGGGL
ncbi:MAG: hypothetical protein ABI488_23510 [Polyangiaceae bacterium]